VSPRAFWPRKSCIALRSFPLFPPLGSDTTVSLISVTGNLCALRVFCAYPWAYAIGQIRIVSCSLLAQESRFNLWHAPPMVPQLLVSPSRSPASSESLCLGSQPHLTLRPISPFALVLLFFPLQPSEEKPLAQPICPPFSGYKVGPKDSRQRFI